MSDDISIPSPTYRVPRHARGMDPGTRKLAMIAAGIGGFLIAVGGGWHMLSQHHYGVPVVQAESGPMRVKPANPGGLQVAGANNDIFSGGSDTNGAQLAPPPQTPDPQALQAMETPIPALAPAIVPPPVPAPAPVRTTAALATATVAEPQAATGAREAAPTIVPAAAATKPSAAAVTPPPAHALDKPVAATGHAVDGHDVQVQLAALASEQAAHAEWDRLTQRWPELLRGHPPAFSQIDRGGHVLWRVRASGFEDMSQAAVFCERLRAKGGGCSVADF